MSHGNRSWSDEELDILRRMARTCSTAEIAWAINRACETNRTRNAVIGMARREGVSLGGKPRANLPKTKPRPEGPQKPRRKRKARKQAKPSPDCYAAYEAKPRASQRRLAPVPPYSVQTVPYDACRWIDGDPADEKPFACGAKAVPLRPYCADHTKRAEGHQRR